MFALFWTLEPKLELDRSSLQLTESNGAQEAGPEGRAEAGEYIPLVEVERGRSAQYPA